VSTHKLTTIHHSKFENDTINTNTGPAIITWHLQQHTFLSQQNHCQTVGALTQTYPNLPKI